MGVAGLSGDAGLFGCTGGRLCGGFAGPVLDGHLLGHDIAGPGLAGCGLAGPGPISCTQLAKFLHGAESQLKCGGRIYSAMIGQHGLLTKGAFLIG